MKKRYKILVVLICVSLLTMIATLPELIAVWPERKVVQQTFSNYADALISQNFDKAYGYTSPEFKEAISFQSFVQYQHDVQAKFGVLKSVKQKGMTVQRWRNPSRWNASIVADFQYTTAKVRFTFELRREDGHWTIFTSKGEEK